MYTRILRNLIYLVLGFMLSFAAFMAFAEGDEYMLGTGATHLVECDPPTTREEVDGVQAPIEIADLDFNTLTLHSETFNGPVLFTIQTDIYCGGAVGVGISVDDFPAGQYHIRATVTDKGLDEQGPLTSRLSDTASPFLSKAPNMKPTAPIITK